MTADMRRISENEFRKVVTAGRAEGKLEVARVLLGIGMDIYLICKTTGLSEDQVRFLGN